MQTRVRLGLMALVLGLALVASLSAADKATTEKVASLIEKLGSGDFADREKATKDLEAIGEDAYDGLKKASQSDDLETKRRAEELLKKIESKVLAKKVLEPTKIQFTFKDTPLKDALAEVQKKSGLTITLNDPQNKLADRKVTLDTGESTLLEAVDQFIQKAGLVDSINPAEVFGPGTQPLPRPLPRPVLRPGIKILPAIPAPVAPPPPVDPVPPVKPPEQIALPPAAFLAQVQVLPAVPAQALPIEVARVPPPFPGMAPNTLVLSDGQSHNLPTHYAGAVRIRALPPTTNIPGYAKPEGELVVPLQVTAEPKIQLQSVVGIRINKAVDDKDQGLLQAMAEGDNAIPRNDAVPFARAAFVARPPVMGAGVAPVPVRLKKGEKESKKLKELSGVVTLQVRPAAEEVMKIDKLMDAAGQEAKCDGGGRMKVLEVKKTEQGTTFKIEFEQPQDIQGGAANFPNGPVQFQLVPLPLPPQPAPAPQFQNNAQVQVQVQVGGFGGGRAAPFFPGGANGLTVKDEKGQDLPLSISQSQAQARNGGPVLWQYTFTVQPQKDQGEPAKLAYSGSRLVTIDVPFSLKEIPLQ